MSACNDCLLGKPVFIWGCRDHSYDSLSTFCSSYDVSVLQPSTLLPSLAFSHKPGSSGLALSLIHPAKICISEDLGVANSGTSIIFARS